MKFFYLLILSFIGIASYAMKKIDTLYVHDTVYISRDNEHQLKSQENYLKFYESLLDQKQKHYDSTLNLLSLLATIFGIAISIFVVFEFISNKKQRKTLENEHKEALEKHKIKIEKELKEKIEELINEKIITYNEDLKDLMNKNDNLDRVVREICDNYILRHDKNKPEIGPIVNPLSNVKDPFNAKK